MDQVARRSLLRGLAGSALVMTGTVVLARRSLAGSLAEKGTPAGPADDVGVRAQALSLDAQFTVDTHAQFRNQPGGTFRNSAPPFRNQPGGRAPFRNTPGFRNTGFRNAFRNG